MNNTYIKLFTGSLLLATLLTGCGENIRDLQTDTTIQPHQINSRTLVSPKQTVDYINQWHNQVSISSIYDRQDESDHKFSIEILFDKGISNDAKHFQVYLNTDNNQDTGFSIGEKNCATLGADFMIEDNKLFKSTSHTVWQWEFVDEVNYEIITLENNKTKIQISGNSSKLMSVFDIDNIKNIFVSVEPVNENWQDTDNFISERNIKMQVLINNDTIKPEQPIIVAPIIVAPQPEIKPEKPVIIEPIVVAPQPEIKPEKPVIIEPIIVAPQPEIKPEKPIVEISNETIYEDAEEGLNANWITILGKYNPQRRTPGYKDESKAFVKLQNEWIPLGGELWENKSEYQLPLNNNKNQKILSIDIVGDGLQMQHYTLGAKVTTKDGARILQWDSFFNHEKLDAMRKVYDNGAIIITFPSPVELVRGYEFSDPNLEENFKVNLEVALKKFEPNNTIISVDTLIATGGNLDNIKLMSK